MKLKINIGLLIYELVIIGAFIFHQIDLKWFLLLWGLVFIAGGEK